MPLSHVVAYSEDQTGRARLATGALRLLVVSVVFGALSGCLSVVIGVLDHSLGVLGTLADLTGSAVLIWRFQTERLDPIRAAEVEARAGIVISIALAAIGAALVGQSIAALLAGTHPGSSATGIVTAGVALVVLAPLACTKRKTAAALASGALRGDGTLSAIGTATALLALVGFLLYHALGWRWADRVVAPAVVDTAEAHGIGRPLI
jgi:divalent metal cation (Fe/Co/Zn/Cd) transporter